MLVEHARPLTTHKTSMLDLRRIVVETYLRVIDPYQLSTLGIAIARVLGVYAGTRLDLWRRLQAHLASLTQS